MFELYKSDFLRLRKWSLIALVLLIVVYHLLARFGFWDILHRNMGIILTAAFIALSLGFGLLHAILWRSKNNWVFLIHRPIAPQQIYFSLLASGVSAICLTIFTSLMITTIGFDVLSEKVVDARHYLFALYITLLSIASYLVGTLTVLHRSKFVIMSFYCLAVVFFPQPQNTFWQFFPLIMLLIALVYLNVQCFKPNLNQPLDSPLAQGLIATSMSYAFVVVLILSTTLFYHLPLALMGSHPDMGAEDGSMRLVWQDNRKNGVAYVLENSEHPLARHYGEQAKLADARNVPLGRWQLPRHHQLARYDNSNALYDNERGTVWKFSHDEMLLIGFDPVTQKSIGAIGMNGYLSGVEQASTDDLFPLVPHLSGGQFLSTDQAMYLVDFESQTLITKHQLDDQETYTSSLWVGQHGAAISTTEQVFIFDTATLSDPYSSLHVDYQFDLPKSVENAENAFSYNIADGYVILFIGMHYYGFDRPGAEVFVTRLDGSFERLGGREFTVFDHPDWIRHYNFMVSPVIYVTEKLLMHRIDPFDTRFYSWQQLQSHQYSNTVYVIAIVLQVLSAIVLWVLLSRQVVTKKLKYTWLGIGVLFGLPALLSFLILKPLKQA